MAKRLMTEKPEKVSTIPVDMPGGFEGQAPNLDDAVLQVIWDIKEAEGWSWPQTARAFGIGTQTLYDLLLLDEHGNPKPDGEASPRRRGMTMFTFSKIVGAMAHGNPILFFKKHPMFGKVLQPSKGDSADAHVQLCARLSRTQAERLVQIVDQMLRRDALDDFLSSTEVLVGVATTPKRRRPKTRSKKSR